MRTLGQCTLVAYALGGCTYNERDERNDDDTERGVEVRRHFRERLAADDRVYDEVALHREHVQHARDDRAVVPVLESAPNAGRGEADVTDPHENRLSTMDRVPSFGPNIDLLAGVGH